MPQEEQTYRQSQDQRMQKFETDMRNSNTRIEMTIDKGFEEVHRRQDITNGRVQWTEKMLYLGLGGLGVLSIIVFPLLLALLQNGKL